MPLSNDSSYGVRPMTESINLLPSTPSIIRGLSIFKSKPISTTTVEIAMQNNELVLVPSLPRGTPGQPAPVSNRYSKAFKVPHLPMDDVVRADDVQNIKTFGTDNKPMAVAELVNDKLQTMKQSLELTREHHQLGALGGKILDADGSTIVDIYNEFGISRPEYTWALGTASTQVNQLIDDVKIKQSQKRRGEYISGWVALCSPEFLQALTYHKSITELYTHYQQGATQYLGDTEVSFKHKNIHFVLYDHSFGTEADIKSGEAYLLPMGTRNCFREFFAPADMNATVNTMGKPYYASREKLNHDKGWSLHAQSNPLNIVLRPELVATLKMS